MHLLIKGEIAIEQRFDLCGGERKKTLLQTLGEFGEHCKKTAQKQFTDN